MKMIRLRKGGRYVVVMASTSGDVVSGPFWSEIQAFAASGLNFLEWSSIPTEVYGEIHPENVPRDRSVFVRSSRRGQIHGVILWTKDGIFPKVLDSIAAAVVVGDDRQEPTFPTVSSIRAA